jgi:tRNA nucleotidyltransferase (CCA-adding enzyme)
MQTYLVGGAVRDALLDIPVGERDWVVVGADAGQMRQLGFEPVHAGFPVFRHPETGEEYALARRETKTGAGYHGFAVDAGPDVSLEQDLQRRDLTINAMARAEDGSLVDPFDGREDLDAGLLRHVTPAFVEDPLRVLRVARFVAKLGVHGFRVAHGTHRLMRRMVDDGAMAELPAERVGRETLKAMRTPQPWRFFEVLHRCGALAELLPLLDEAMGVAGAHGVVSDSPPIAALKRAAGLTEEPVARLLAGLWSVARDDTGAQRLAASLRLDRAAGQALQRIALLSDRADIRAPEAGTIADLAVAWHGLQPAQVQPLAVAWAAQADPAGERLALLTAARRAARACDTASIRATGLKGPDLGRAIRTAQRAAALAVLDAGQVTERDTLP